MQRARARWYAIQVFENSPVLPEKSGKKFENHDIAQCKHVEGIFRSTRVLDNDPDFCEKVCRHPRQAISNHPVLVLGEWRQAKSSLINSLCHQEDDSGAAAVGRYAKTTQGVELHEMPLDECESSGLGDESTVLLVDTPGLEPDMKNEIFKGYRQAMRARDLSPEIGTGLVVVVCSSTPQALSSMDSKYVTSWILETFQKARKSATGSCRILPVLTMADSVCDKQSLEQDKMMLQSKLQSAVDGKKLQCSAGSIVASPIAVTNFGSGRAAENIDVLRAKIVQVLKERTSTPEFRAQWSGMLVKDLQDAARMFHKIHPHKEAETHLMHKVIESQLATHHRSCSGKIEDLLPDCQADWRVVDVLERKLQGSETWFERGVDMALQRLPWSPSWSMVLPVLLVVGATARKRVTLHIAKRFPTPDAGLPPLGVRQARRLPPHLRAKLRTPWQSGTLRAKPSAAHKDIFAVLSRGYVSPTLLRFARHGGERSQHTPQEKNA